MQLCFSLWHATSSRSQAVSVGTVCRSLSLKDERNAIKMGTGAGKVCVCGYTWSGEIDYKGVDIVMNNCPGA